MKINLDTLGSKKPVDYKTPAEGTAGPTTLSSGEMGLVLSASAKTKAPDASNSIAEMYHKLKRLIYLVDVSDSTNAVMAGAEAIEQYQWNDGWEADVKEKITAAVEEVKKVEDALAELDVDDEDEDGIPAADVVELSVPARTTALAGLKEYEGEDLKAAMIASGLAPSLVPRNYVASIRYGRSPEEQKLADDQTKLGLTKKMTAKVVTDRLDKYPDADVVCATFNHTVTFLQGNTKQALLDNIAKIEPNGGTNIYFAVETMINFVTQAPARVKMNHIVLVTDAEDYNAKNLPDLLPKLKENGIVLDFIYVKQPFENRSGEAAGKIKEVCDATGGQYKEVQSAKEFETVFLERSQRLCLPPASK